MLLLLEVCKKHIFCAVILTRSVWGLQENSQHVDDSEHDILKHMWCTIIVVRYIYSK